MQQLLSYTTTIAFFSLNAATIQAVVLLNLMLAQGIESSGSISSSLRPKCTELDTTTLFNLTL